jgi:hypothetical protein
MYIVSIGVRGHRDLPRYNCHDLQRVMSLAGPSPAVTALGDAIELGFAALSWSALEQLCRRWGLIASDAVLPREGDELPDSVQFQDPDAARALVDPAAQRALKVELELALDPPLFGQLRELAVREPRVVTALAARPTVTLRVGALFTSSHDALAITLQGVSVGEQPFQVHGSERPSWLGRFLRGLRDRFHRYEAADSHAADLLACATSRGRHDQYQRWQQSMGADGPFLRAARGVNDRPILLADDLPLRRLGHCGQRRAQLAAAIHLSGADIVWAEPGASADLLRAAVEGNASPLEQVFCVTRDGELEVAAEVDTPAAALGGGRPWGERRP